MQCPQCQHENASDAKFCNQCAAPFAPVCSACGHENTADAKFCNQCGTSLTSYTPLPDFDQRDVQDSRQEPSSIRVTASPAESPMPEAERRQLTVMFCDLVGSTPLAGQLDPEDLREVVRAYQECAAGVIQQYDGHIAQYLGDGLLIYFGWPHAHEDDAHRAVHTGLGIVEALDGLNTTLETAYGVRLAVRLGIHTGPVVVGEMGGGGRYENLALSETPNIAARLEGLTSPNGVVISDATYQLVEGYFVCEALGEQSLKGLAQPLNLYRVVQESGAQSRLDAAWMRGLTPLVGRDTEVTLLLERWRQVEDESG